MDSRTWLITGCSSGFGRATALAALIRGDRVIATARHTAALADLARVFPEACLPQRLDVTSPEQIRHAVDEGIERFGTIDAR